MTHKDFDRLLWVVCKELAILEKEAAKKPDWYLAIMRELETRHKKTPRVLISGSKESKENIL